MRRDQASASQTTGWFVLLWLAWLLVPANLFVAAVTSVPLFTGEEPTAAEEAQANRLFLLAALVAVAIPVVGLSMSLRARRQGSAAAFVLAGGMALIAAVLLVVGMAKPEPRSAIPSRDPGGACQEHSGGDNRCPGG